MNTKTTPVEPRWVAAEWVVRLLTPEQLTQKQIEEFRQWIQADPQHALLYKRIHTLLRRFASNAVNETQQ